MQESSPSTPWWRLLNRYHWFVLIVASLGWLFDCLDQQLFNLARVPAMRDLLEPGQSVPEWGGYATSIFLIGWATGGLTFGVLGDKIGRAKTMMFTILIYSICTGLSALSTGFWDFAFYRFITGLGVGGEFAVGVALVAEVMPRLARPHALGLLQALSAVGNVTAASLTIWLGRLEETGVSAMLMGWPAWRWMFVIGAIPALLALVIRMYLKEPDRWLEMKAASKTGAPGTELGSYAELFGNPKWHHGAIGAGSSVIAILAIAFAGPASWPKLQINTALAFLMIAFGLWMIYGGGSQASPESKRWRRNAVVGMLLACSGVIGLWGIGFFSIDLQRSVFRKALEAEGLTGTALSGKLTVWSGITAMMLQVGAFTGMFLFSRVMQKIGRRPAFALALTASMLSTAMVFAFLDDLSDIFWMMPIMGFCQFSLFAGYAIYFPELFPTNLRSTGTSFCYNVGRFLAASGPTVLGLLTSKVFIDQPEPMRYAGVSMCAVFLLGLLVIPFAPETKDQPLPEDERGFSH